MKPLHTLALPLASAFLNPTRRTRSSSLIYRHHHQSPATTTSTSLYQSSDTSSTSSSLTQQQPPPPPQQHDQTNTTLYNSLRIPPGASTRSISDAELAIQTKIRGRFSITELIEINGDRDADRASLAVLGIFIGGTSTAILAEQTLPGPEILRFTLTWLLSFSPLIFTFFGLTIPSQLQRVLTACQRLLFKSYRHRVVQHEAGHFLMGYLLGYPVGGYSVGGMMMAVTFERGLRDDEAGERRARELGFDKKRVNENDDARQWVSSDDATTTTNGGGGYFDKGGRGESFATSRSVFRNDEEKSEKYSSYLTLPPRDDPKKSWPYRGFSPSTLDTLSVISLAGVASEILSYGTAEGGYADLDQLRRIFNAAASTEKMEEREMENRVQYALGYAVSQLRLHRGVLDELAREMERGGSVSECVAVIENCGNVRGNVDEVERRKQLREEMSLIERLFLGGKKMADVEKSVVEGKGGGDMKGGVGLFQMEGDDPFYAAAALALVFFVWASAGGLSLH